LKSKPKPKSFKLPTKKERELKKFAAHNYAGPDEDDSKPSATENRSSTELSCIRKSKRLNVKKTE
jgi:hypothetical protein